MIRPKGLGRGLDALLAGDDDNDATDTLQSIAIERVQPDRYQPRTQMNDAALEELPSALDSIDRQREDLVAMLESLEDLSSVGVRVIRASKEATIDSLEALDPVLTQLAASGDDFTKAFHVFLTYPFVDEVVGRDPQVARNLHMGDYTNLSITLDVDLTGIPTTIPTTLPTEACIPLSALPQDGPLPDTRTLCQDALDAINTCLEGLRRGDGHRAGHHGREQGSDNTVADRHGELLQSGFREGEGANATSTSSMS